MKLATSSLIFTLVFLQCKTTASHEGSASKIKMEIEEIITAAQKGASTDTNGPRGLCNIIPNPITLGSKITQNFWTSDPTTGDIKCINNLNKLYDSNAPSEVKNWIGLPRFNEPHNRLDIQYNLPLVWKTQEITNRIYAEARDIPYIDTFAESDPNYVQDKNSRKVTLFMRPIEKEGDLSYYSPYFFHIVKSADELDTCLQLQTSNFVFIPGGPCTIFSLIYDSTYFSGRDWENGGYKTYLKMTRDRVLDLYGMHTLPQGEAFGEIVRADTNFAFQLTSRDAEIPTGEIYQFRRIGSSRNTVLCRTYDGDNSDAMDSNNDNVDRTKFDTACTPLRSSWAFFRPFTYNQDSLGITGVTRIDVFNHLIEGYLKNHGTLEKTVRGHCFSSHYACTDYPITLMKNIKQRSSHFGQYYFGGERSCENIAGDTTSDSESCDYFTIEPMSSPSRAPRKSIPQ